MNLAYNYHSGGGGGNYLSPDGILFSLPFTYRNLFLEATWLYRTGRTSLPRPRSSTCRQPPPHSHSAPHENCSCVKPPHPPWGGGWRSYHVEGVLAHCPSRSDPSGSLFKHGRVWSPGGLQPTSKTAAGLDQNDLGWGGWGCTGFLFV